MEQVRFVTGKPALLVGKSLVVADLHLGIELEFRRSGIRFPSQTGRVTESLDSLLEETGPDRLVILGDVKHKVPGISLQELREIPEFLSRLSSRMPVDVVPGNHDPGIKDFLSPGVTLHGSAGFRAGDVYLSHGHTWPDRSFLECSCVVVGHRHPVVEFRDKLGYRFREPVWLKGTLDPSKVSERYGKARGKLPEVIVMPAFSGLAGGVAVNAGRGGEGESGPLFRSLRKGSVKVHMLDGTYLGMLSQLRKKPF